MNELLRDLINMGKVVTFINDIITYICETREVQVEGKESRVFGSGNQAREYKDGGKEGERYFGLANTEVCQGCSKVLNIGKLLLSIHSGCCIHNKTII